MYTYVLYIINTSFNGGHHQIRTCEIDQGGFRKQLNSRFCIRVLVITGNVSDVKRIMTRDLIEVLTFVF